MATPIRTRATTPKSNARATTPKSNATQTHARKATPTRSLAMTPNRLGNTTPARSNARNSGFDEPSTSRGSQNVSLLKDGLFFCTFNFFCSFLSFCQKNRRKKVKDRFFYKKRFYTNIW